eukprot:c52215_g1_i1.p1 GENE.c52215_g1_i1~~c52215_g1_i1.p1  ORF type:complete len:288 (-),score=55.28 c52215_g1_i1:59-922(-)
MGVAEVLEYRMGWLGVLVLCLFLVSGRARDLDLDDEASAIEARIFPASQGPDEATFKDLNTVLDALLPHFPKPIPAKGNSEDLSEKDLDEDIDARLGTRRPPSVVLDEFAAIHTDDPPAMIVLDLDHTLWDRDIHTLQRPFKVIGSSVISDARGIVSHVSSDITHILDESKRLGCRVAIASRTPMPLNAKLALRALGFVESIDYLQIWFNAQRDKSDHLRRLSQDSGVALSDMLFFDDDNHIINRAHSLGVPAVLVDREQLLTFKLFKSSVENFTSLQAYVHPVLSD